MRNPNRTTETDDVPDFKPASAGGQKPPDDTDPRTLAGLATIYEHEGFHLRIKSRSWAGFQVALRVFGCERVTPHGTQPGVWKQVGPPDCTSRTAVEGWMLALTRRTPRPLSRNTVNGYLGNCAAVASDAGHASRCLDVWHTFQTVRKLTVDEKPRRAAPLDAVELLSQLAAHAGEVAVIRLALLGARTREIFALRVTDYDRAAGVVRITRSRKGETSRKNGSVHTIPCDDATREAIEWTLRSRDQLYPAHGARPLQGLLFPFASERWYGERLAVWRHALGERADEYLPQGTGLYALRHLGASIVARQSGGDAVAVARHLGDRSLKVAAGYVAQVRGALVTSRDDVARVAGAVDDPHALGLDEEPTGGAWDAPRAAPGGGGHLGGGRPPPARPVPGRGPRRPAQLRLNDPATTRAAARRAVGSRWEAREAERERAGAPEPVPARHPAPVDPRPRFTLDELGLSREDVGLPPVPASGSRAFPPASRVAPARPAGPEDGGAVGGRAGGVREGPGEAAGTTSAAPDESEGVEGLSDTAAAFLWLLGEG
jgi:integrase